MAEINIYAGSGRPPKYKTVKDLQKEISLYFSNPPTKAIRIGDSIINVPALTITGLALHLGFESRQSFYDYEKLDKFTYTIKRARAFIENEYEKMLHFNNVTGAIFALKNFGWKDTLDQRIEYEAQPMDITFQVSTAIKDVIVTTGKKKVES